jgi:hypothetical protein
MEESSVADVSEEYVASIFRIDDICDMWFNRTTAVKLPEDGGNRFLRNICDNVPDYTSTHP